MVEQKNRRFNLLFKKDEEAKNYKLYINDVIEGDCWWEKSETGANYFADKLAEVPDDATLEIHINSDGGDVYEATAIYNLLKQHKATKVGIVDGHAFSAAAFILQACDERVMLDGTTMLVHNAWTFAIGNAKELRKVADDLDTVMESNRKLFLQRCKLSEDELIKLMDEDKIITAEKALEYGFTDRIGSDSAEDPEEEPEESPEEEPEPEEEPVGAPAQTRKDWSAAAKYFKKFY